MLSRRVVARPASIEELLSLAEHYAALEGTLLLLSGSNYDSAERSFLCLFPYQKVSIETSVGPYFNPWEQLKEKLQFSKELSDIPEWGGYLTYEMGGFADADVAIPLKVPDDPLACFYRYAVILSYSHAALELTLFAKEGCVETSEIEELWSLLERGVIAGNTPREKIQMRCTKPLEEREAYFAKIARAKEFIYKGDIYQVNLSQECCYEGAFSPYSLFKQLYKRNPAPFSAYLKMGPQRAIVSSSPERLLRLSQGKLETRPIKGTAPRGRTPQEDEANRIQLINSEKDKSELLMITDLMRNDLGRISSPGSVKVEKIWKCEAYQNVFHLLSVISAEAIPSLHPVDRLRALFPGGSITGCPKIRAMEIIFEIENAVRGIYTGSIGYFTSCGDFDFNIAIRTLDVAGEAVTLRLGGAIVADSCPEKEYEETLHKGRTLFETLKSEV